MRRPLNYLLVLASLALASMSFSASAQIDTLKEDIDTRFHATVYVFEDATNTLITSVPISGIMATSSYPVNVVREQTYLVGGTITNATNQDGVKTRDIMIVPSSFAVGFESVLRVKSQADKEKEHDHFNVKKLAGATQSSLLPAPPITPPVFIFEGRVIELDEVKTTISRGHTSQVPHLSAQTFSFELKEGENVKRAGKYRVKIDLSFQSLPSYERDNSRLDADESPTPK